MPIFEYRCQTCQHDFEVLVRANEPAVCPHCNSQELDKLLSAPAAHTGSLRGSLPITNGCEPVGPPCSPTCCRLPHAS